ncbi:protocadherin beta-15-like [Dreissena polymorpha]|uniref:Cadherin domain-containing protein n=1 Tax=Dreissena polymorpha TaxID=45954 RepID=A0A9D4K5D9_DREPO|nr:protocadherin beta-15-like [Dreissena polymorpha]XP_052281391.1 protocadherin beta-15-like [Dreissena polymorpha]XP_052281392.1 protocadherin beta-15-like [Dreissena polymorpha]XP_052281394.1 protocadherin beta-15-like [Dreissena polymorpha]KAH3833363.1 hypothetical protein DPMN_106670 [Dreissena polymorpha]
MAILHKTEVKGFFLQALILLLINHILGQEDAIVKYDVREEKPPGTFIGSIGIESELFQNLTNEQFKRLQFQVLPTPGNKYLSYFRIEANTSLLWTRERIDREMFPDCFETCLMQFFVGVYAIDIGEMTKMIRIDINILDENDNTPKFSSIQNPLYIPESKNPGESILSGAAVDLDQSRNNSVKSYLLMSETGTFSLKVHTENDVLEFVLALKSSLDYESRKSYEIVLLAVDGGDVPKTGSLSLQIFVTDINDNVPTFQQRTYNTSVEENIPLNSTVLQLRATDRDSGENGMVSYRFSSRISDHVTNLFGVQSNGDIVAKGIIDYEKDKEFGFEVIAYDGGVNFKSSSVSVFLKVIDMNDNSPVININQPPSGTLITESAETGSFVLLLEVLDIDSNENGLVNCNILDDSFDIVSTEVANNYKIVLRRELDRETKASHNVTIDCEDSGIPPKRTVKHFIVLVQDANDNAPDFVQQTYIAVVNENSPFGSSLLTVSAIDKDSGKFGKVSYSLHSESKGLFKIDPFSGLILVNSSIDREKYGDRMIFRVFAEDGGDSNLISTGTIVVTILDINDNDPEFFLNPITFSVSEDAKVGWIVGNISASDPDNGPNGTVLLKFPEDPNVREYFKFNESGIITISKQLDREKVAFHEFYVYAMDMGGRTSSARVTIFVTDVNDNAPEIVYPNEYDNTFRVRFTMPVFSDILQIDAHDLDSDENSKLYYYIDQDNSSYAFNLNLSSGKLTLNRSLHQTEIGHRFLLYLRVKDGGASPIQTWTELLIEVIEVELNMVDKVAQANLWIVVGIVIVTAVLSVVMILLIVKICWYNRRKGLNSSSIIIESNEVDPQLIDSSSSSFSSASSTSSHEINLNTKIQHGGMHSDSSYEKGYYDKLDEADFIPKSEQDSGLLYMQEVKKLDLELHKKLDETTSDNSGELGTRDSGQGGSDLDNISIPEMTSPGSPDSAIGHLSPRELYYSSHLGHPHQRSPDVSTTDANEVSTYNVVMPKLVPDFSHFPTKTAERKELSKLRLSKKRVMFSDDLENSHSSGRSSTVSDLVNPDGNHDNRNSVQRFYNRTISEELPVRLYKSNSWFRRSADNLTLRHNKDNRDVYNQMPSNLIKSKDFRNKPMGDNIKGYLDRVISRTRTNSDGSDLEAINRTNTASNVYTLSEDVTSHTGPWASDCTTTSAPSSIYRPCSGENSLNLASHIEETDDVYSEDFDV